MVNLQALQQELSPLQEPANITQVQICDQKDADFPVEFLGIDVIALYDTSTNMSCMSYACCEKLKDLPSLKTVPSMSVHTATGHD